MKKRMISLLLIVILMLAFSATAFADDNKVTGSVMYNGTTLTPSISASELNSAAGTLQPGDSLTIEMSLGTSFSGNTDYYMSNAVGKAFEDSAASGGAYTYRLSYVSPKGTETVFYDNSTVGGTTSGLMQATGGLSDFFFVDTLGRGQAGTVRLYVKLDGETIDPNYQDKLANLSLIFGVEQDGRRFVRTGDSTDMMPYLLVSAFSGLALLTAAVVLLSRSRKARNKAEQ